MGIMARDVLCVLVLLQLLCLCQCHDGGRKLELPKRGLTGTENNVLRASLVHRDSGSNATASERFLAGVKRSQDRVARLEKSLGVRAAAAAAASGLQSPVTSGMGEYLMKIAVGTPAKQFTAVADTGSDLNWVQCSPCTQCFQQPDALFKPSASSTYKQVTCSDALCRALYQRSCNSKNTCTYFYSYGDMSSTQGDLAYETITLGNSAVPHVAFGCGRNNQGTFAGDADGLVGLAQGPLSLPSQLSPSVAEIFSYCLVQLGSTSSSPIIFGNAAENANVIYTPLVTNGAIQAPYYYVGVTAITIGGRAVAIPASAFQIASDGSGGVILDSGTTLTQWPQAIFNPILAAFRQQIDYPEKTPAVEGFSLCYDISSVALSSVTFPSMVVSMANNVKYAIPSENLFFAVDSTGKTICLAMGLSDSLAIIGNLQQMNILIVYDVVNKRVGFQTKQCDAM